MELVNCHTYKSFPKSYLSYLLGNTSLDLMANKKESTKITFILPIEPLDVVGIRDIGFPISLAKTESGGAAPVFFDRESKSWKPALSLTVGAVLDAERWA